MSNFLKQIQKSGDDKEIQLQGHIRKSIKDYK